MEFEPYLAARVRRRVRSGGLAREWALRRLFRAGDHGDPLATDVAWELWLEQPDGRLWTALNRWRRPHSRGGQSLVALGRKADPADVAAAAGRVGHPVAAAARAAALTGDQDVVAAVCAAATTDDGLAAFCRAHHLAPADPHQAAVYFLLTGQAEQYRLTDPDHSLLALVYQGAAEDERARIRAASAEEPALVRALAGTVRRGGLTRLADREAAYLVDAFAGRRDWPGLWALAKNLPVFDAAAAVRRFDGWHPPGAADAALFDLLAAAEPDALAASYRAVTTPGRARVDIRFATDGSISPDDRRVVISTTRSVSVHTFPGAEPVETWPTRHNNRILALAGGVQVHTCWDKKPGDTGFYSTGYVGGADEPPATGTTKFHEAGRLARTADGFAALARGDDETLHLHLVSGSGWRFAGYRRRSVELGAAFGMPGRYARGQWAMATDPDSGLIAFAGHRVYVARLSGDGLALLGTAPFAAGLQPSLAFSGPDRLIGLDDRILRVWRVDDDGPHVLAERKLAASSPVDLPGAGVIVVTDLSGNTGRSLRFLDRDTLADVPALPGYDGRGDPGALFTSKDGDWLGVCFRDFVELFEVRLSTLATRPLAATTPADLHAVRAGRGGAPAAARTFLDLLQACLEHRFGTDVALGDAAGDAVAARADDIALGGGT